MWPKSVSERQCHSKPSHPFMFDSSNLVTHRFECALSVSVRVNALCPYTLHDLDKSLARRLCTPQVCFGCMALMNCFTPIAACPVAAFLGLGVDLIKCVAPPTLEIRHKLGGNFAGLIRHLVISKESDRHQGNVLFLLLMRTLGRLRSFQKHAVAPRLPRGTASARDVVT